MTSSHNIHLNSSIIKTSQKQFLSLHQMAGNRQLLKRLPNATCKRQEVYVFLGVRFPLVCSICFSACKWSAEANIPEFPPSLCLSPTHKTVSLAAY